MEFHSKYLKSPENWDMNVMIANNSQMPYKKDIIEFATFITINRILLK